MRKEMLVKIAETVTRWLQSWKGAIDACARAQLEESVLGVIKSTLCVSEGVHSYDTSGRPVRRTLLLYRGGLPPQIPDNDLRMRLIEAKRRPVVCERLDDFEGLQWRQLLDWLRSHQRVVDVVVADLLLDAAALHGYGTRFNAVVPMVATSIATFSVLADGTCSSGAEHAGLVVHTSLPEMMGGYPICVVNHEGGFGSLRWSGPSLCEMQSRYTPDRLFELVRYARSQLSAAVSAPPNDLSVGDNAISGSHGSTHSAV